MTYFTEFTVNLGYLIRFNAFQLGATVFPRCQGSDKRVQRAVQSKGADCPFDILDTLL